MLPHYYLTTTGWFAFALFYSAFFWSCFLFLSRNGATYRSLWVGVCVPVYVLVGCHVNKEKESFSSVCAQPTHKHTPPSAHKHGRIFEYLYLYACPRKCATIFPCSYFFVNTFYLLLIMQLHLISFLRHYLLFD